MERTNKVYLQDILQAINLILGEYTMGMNFAQLAEDKKTQDAVIRQIAIIGEAMARIDNHFAKSHPELPTREAIAMRNVLVHDYDWVDVAEVWKTIEHDLPALKEIVVNIIDIEFRHD